MAEGAANAEFEVTPAMIEAGLVAFEEEWCDAPIGSVAAVRVVSAILQRGLEALAPCGTTRTVGPPVSAT